MAGAELLGWWLGAAPPGPAPAISPARGVRGRTKKCQPRMRARDEDERAGRTRQMGYMAGQAAASQMVAGSLTVFNENKSDGRTMQNPTLQPALRRPPTKHYQLRPIFTRAGCASCGSCLPSPFPARDRPMPIFFVAALPFLFCSLPIINHDEMPFTRQVTNQHNSKERRGTIAARNPEKEEGEGRPPGLTAAGAVSGSGSGGGGFRPAQTTLARAAGERRALASKWPVRDTHQTPTPVRQEVEHLRQGGQRVTDANTRETDTGGD